MKRLRLLLADDHDIVIEGLRRVLDHPDLEIAGVVNDGRSLLRAAKEIQPDIIIADITMPLLNGIDAARQIRETNADVKIIFLTMHPDVTFATEALAAGGYGYVLKNSAGDELVTAIREAAKGRTYVTKSIAESVQQGAFGSIQYLAKSPGQADITPARGVAVAGGGSSGQGNRGQAARVSPYRGISQVPDYG